LNLTTEGLAADGTSVGKLPQNLAAVPAAAKQNAVPFTPGIAIPGRYNKYFFPDMQ